jgi:phosphatidylserine/phosphatidylglycerophosphate/cardiolipin synthase-like enzyme
MSLALLSATRAEEYDRQAQRVELVWTGPESRAIAVRRTEQALLQVINGARQRLLIVSFVVYDIDEIAQALLRSARRRVSLTICLETPDASAGRVAYNTLRALGDDLSQQAHLYYWPLSKRPTSPDGRQGSLHAKVAVADGNTMLVSSANLTGNAMSLNMELGMLVHGGELPTAVEAHFRELIAAGALELIRG